MSARILKWKTSDADAIYWNNYWGETGKVCSWPNVLKDNKSMPDRYAHKQIKTECIIKWAERNCEQKAKKKWQNCILKNWEMGIFPSELRK